MSKLNQYELITTKTEWNDMPFQVYAKDKSTAKRYAMRKLQKGERIISLNKVV
jgi:hypothetical protein